MRSRSVCVLHGFERIQSPRQLRTSLRIDFRTRSATPGSVKTFMPELPEVETIARGLDNRVTGDVVESVWLGQKREPLKSSASEIAATLEHSRILRVRRMGKHIVFDLEPVHVARAPSPAKSRKLDQKRDQKRDQNLKGKTA